MAPVLIRPVAAGRPGTQVIPDAWAEAHATPVAGTMTATVELRLPGSTLQWSDEDQATVATPHDPYAADQVARIQAVTAGATAADVVGETIHVRGYLVALPASIATVAPGHQIRVTACKDPSLVGRDLTVTDVLRGSELFQRDVFATLND